MSVVIQIGSRQCGPLIEAIRSYFTAIDSIEVLEIVETSFEFRAVRDAVEQVADSFCGRRVSG